MWVLVVSAVASGMTSGCVVEEFFENLEGRATQVDVFVGHRATPIDGLYPESTDGGEIRTFSNDLGWVVTLVDGFVVTRSATFEGCDGTRHPVDFWRGPVVEDLLSSDQDLLTAGSLQLEPGEYCRLRIQYGPFAPDEDETQSGSDPWLQGKTMAMASGAALGDDVIPVDFELEHPVVVEVDLSTLDEGEPLTIRGDEHFPIELSVWKTYDRFFDGIDFGHTEAPIEEITARAAPTLRRETRVNLGMMPPAGQDDGR